MKLILTLLNVFGLYTTRQLNEQLGKKENENKFLRSNLESCEPVIEAAIHYAGTCAVWKAHQEYREVLSFNNVRITSNYIDGGPGHLSHAESVDRYLSSVVKACVTFNTTPFGYKKLGGKYPWPNKSELADYCRDDLLNRLVVKHSQNNSNF